MANSIEYEIRGTEELKLKLSTLSNDLQYRGGRFALRKAANLVADAAMANAKRIDDPASAEDISKNIAVRWSGRSFKTKGDLVFRVGVLGGARRYAKTRDNFRKGIVGKAYKTDGISINPGGDTYYWRFIEFGTKKMRAAPFMLPALSKNVAAATDEFIKQYGKAADRAIKRASR